MQKPFDGVVEGDPGSANKFSSPTWIDRIMSISSIVFTLPDPYNGARRRIGPSSFMSQPRFTLERLKAHSAIICAEAAASLRMQVELIDAGLKEFSGFVDTIKAQPATLYRNVKLMLSTKFLNHVYSSLILTEHGLIFDAILCERNALEVIAFHWLVCLDANAANEYHAQKIPRPVVVRQRLEYLGVDISAIRDLYSSGSEVSHVGRLSERFHSDWSTQLDRKLLFAGSHSSENQIEMFRFLPALLYLFKEPMMVNGR